MNNSRLPSTGSGCTPFHPPASHNNREDCKVFRLKAAIKLMPLSVSLFLILSFGSLLMVAHSQPGAGDDVVHDPFLGEVSELIERYGDVMLPALSYVEHTAAWWERRHENALEMYHREAVNGAEEEEGSSNNDGGLVGEVGSCIGWRQTADCSPHGSRQPHLDQGCQATIAGGASGYCLCARPQQARLTHGKVPHWRGPGVGCNHVPFTCEAMCALHRDKASERDVLTVYDALQRDSSGDVSPTKDGGVEGENVRSSLGGGDGGLEEGAAIEIPAVDVAAARRRFESRYGFLVTDEFEVISKEATVVPGGAAGGGDSSPTFLSERRLWQSSLDGTPFELFPRRRMLHRYLGHSEERARRTTMMARIREALSVRSGSSLTALGATAGMPPSFVKEVFHNAESEASSSPPVGRSSSPMESIVDVRRRLEMEASLRRLHRAIHHQAEQKATDAAHHADTTLPAKRGHLDLPHQHSADDTEDVFHALREFEVEYNLPYRGSLEEGTAVGAVDGSDLKRDGVDVGGGKQDDRRGGSSGPLRHLQQAWDHIKQTALKDISAAASHLNHLLLVGNTTFEHGWKNDDGGDKDARYDLPSLRKLSLIDALLLASALDIGSADVESEIDNIVYSRSEYGEEIARSRFRFVNGSVGRRAEVGGHRRAGRPIGSFNPKQELAEHIAAHCGGNEEGQKGGHSGSRQDTDFVAAGVGALDVSDGRRPRHARNPTSRCYQSKAAARYRRAWAHLLDDVFNDGGVSSSVDDGGVPERQSYQRPHVHLPPALHGENTFALDDFVDNLLFGGERLY